MSTNGSHLHHKTNNGRGASATRDNVVSCLDERSRHELLREYGLAFLGPYCAIVARSLERKQGGAWVTTDTYGAVKDEERCKLLYTSQTS